jgi:hypothetical protein
MIVDTEQHDEDEQHEAGFPCPVCDVITIRQPWASLIALGIKHYEFRSANFQVRGPVVIHASKNWYAPGLRDLVRHHFTKYTGKPDDAIQALFPLARPVAEAVVTDCIQRTEKVFALTLDQVRIITQPKPVLNGMISVPWHAERTKELASALARARVLEGEEKNAVYQEFELMALRSKINTWLKSRGQEEFVLTPLL